MLEIIYSVNNTHQTEPFPPQFIGLVDYVNNFTTCSELNQIKSNRSDVETPCRPSSFSHLSAKAAMNVQLPSRLLPILYFGKELLIRIIPKIIPGYSKSTRQWSCSHDALGQHISELKRTIERTKMEIGDSKDVEDQNSWSTEGHGQFNQISEGKDKSSFMDSNADNDEDQP